MKLKPLRVISLLCLLVITKQAFSNQGLPIRIISLNSNVSEILIAYGLEKSIVGSDVTSQNLWTDKQIKNLGYHRALPPEGILSLKPDLILGSDHMGPNETLKTLTKAKLNIVKLKDPLSSQALKLQVQKIGQLIKASDASDTLTKRIDSKIDTINTLTSGQTKTIILLLNMGQAGLSMAGQKTTGEALIKILNGDFPVSHEGYKPISTEAILAINPDVILIGQRDDNAISQTQLLKEHPLLAHTKAGQTDAIIDINAAKMIAGVSLGLLDEAEQAAQVLNRINTKPK